MRTRPRPSRKNAGFSDKDYERNRQRVEKRKAKKRAKREARRNQK